jgi:hypothetical protein
LARIGVALLQSNFTSIPSKSKWATAEKTARTVQTHAAILARICLTLIDIVIASFTFPA